MSAYHRALDEGDITLIELVRKTPSLYDPSSTNFRLVHRKNEEWIKIAATLGVGDRDARRRWTALRDRYSRELRHMRLYPEEDYGKNEFFRSMDFLRKFVHKRRMRRLIEFPTASGGSSYDDDSPKNTKHETKSTDGDDDLGDTYDTEPTFDVKINDIENNSSINVQQYHDFVEVDGDAPYADYEQSYPDVVNKIKSTKSTIISTALTQTASSVTVTPTAATITAPTYSVTVPLPPTTLQTAEHQQLKASTINTTTNLNGDLNFMEPEDDFFCKSLGAHLRYLSRCNKIKAKVEMFQIMEKYILLEESSRDRQKDDENRK